MRLNICSNRFARGLAVSCASRRQVVLSSASIATVLGAGPATATEIVNYNDFADSYDSLDAGPIADALGFLSLRRDLLSRAAGSVLETGCGTGINLPFYDYSMICKLTGLDLSIDMLAKAREKVLAMARNRPITLEQGDVEAMPFPDSSFDCVVDTFSFCVYEDPHAALREICRVIKPGGMVLMLEHTRSPNSMIGWYQDATADAVAALGKGCYWNQDLQTLLEQAGLQFIKIRYYLGGTVASVEARAPRR